MSDFSVILGRQIRKARKERGITQLQLADQTGLTERTISKVEQGAENITFDNLVEIVRRLDLNPWLIFYPDQSHREAVSRDLQTFLDECDDDEIAMLIPMCRKALRVLREDAASK